MKDLLLDIHQTKEQQPHLQGVPAEAQKKFLQRYQQIIKEGEEEVPFLMKEEISSKKRGKVPHTKERNLLDRFKVHESEILRFMTDPKVPFTNNRAENDIRMTKVHQKISGCFKSLKGAFMFCRIRSYLLTCQKNGISPAAALDMLFQGGLPQFCLA